MEQNIIKPLIQKPKEPESIIISYLTLRKVIGFLGILLIPTLILGGLVLDRPIEVRVSASAYYWSHMRNVLVGTLCCISLFLFSYHGRIWQDSFTSKLAALFALGIAFFPTSPTNQKDDISSKLHYITSGCFFVLLSYMSIFLFTKIYGERTKKKIKRNRIYRICGIVMILSVACIPLDRIQVIDQYLSFLRPVLLLETFTLTAFGLSWLTKGQFILKDDPG